MKDFEKDFKKFQINKDNFPKYDNAESFATRFKRCSIYEYGNISYSNNSNPTPNNKEIQNA